MDRETFGLALKAERERRGWKQVDLAKFLSTSRQYVQLLESGTCPSLATAGTILERMGVKMVIGDQTSRRKISAEGK